MSLIGIINELTVSNIESSIDFYRNIFNFEIEYTDGNPITWVQLRKDNFRIMLEDYNIVTKEIEKIPLKTNSSNIIKFEYNDFEEFKNLYNKCKNEFCEFCMEYTETEYGKIEFGVFDLDKNIILVSFEKN